jgi:ribosomal protein L11 methyltransferase
VTVTPFIITIADLDLEAAQALAEVIDADIRIDARATTINETSEQPSRWQLVAYFDSAAEATAAQAALVPQTVVIAALPRQNWVRQSLEELSPVSAGRFFLHGSHDRKHRRAGGISIEIDAGTAFGTGHHGTTEGCLRALDRIVKARRPRHILDVGCGTGVLAMAAAKAAGTKVLASDIDPEAVRVTRHNAKANGLGSSIKAIVATGLKHSCIAAGAPYDLIFANILARPLVALAQDLSFILTPHGALILSGLNPDQCRWILAAYRNRGLVPVNRIICGNWATLVLTRPQKKKKSARRAFTPGALQPERLAPARRKPEI